MFHLEKGKIFTCTLFSILILMVELPFSIGLISGKSRNHSILLKSFFGTIKILLHFMSTLDSIFHPAPNYITFCIDDGIYTFFFTRFILGKLVVVSTFLGGSRTGWVERDMFERTHIDRLTKSHRHVFH